MAPHFLRAERKELSTWNSISNKNTFRNQGENQDILKWRKTKRICHQHTYPKIMDKRRSINKNDKGTNLRTSETRKETVSKNTSKYNRLSFSGFFVIMVFFF